MYEHLRPGQHFISPKMDNSNQSMFSETLSLNCHNPGFPKGLVYWTPLMCQWVQCIIVMWLSPPKWSHIISYIKTTVGHLSASQWWKKISATGSTPLGSLQRSPGPPSWLGGAHYNQPTCFRPSDLRRLASLHTPLPCPDAIDICGNNHRNARE